MALAANYTMLVGEARSIPYTAQKSDGATPPNISAFDLTNYTLVLSISSGLPSGSAYLLQKSSANGGITITNAPLGLATINMTTPDSIALAGGVYPFDVIAINNSTGGHVPLTSGYWTWSDHPNR
jgi:hypothetical protein